MILLPGDYEFAETLANLPFFYKKTASETCETMHILQKNPNYLPEIVNSNTLQKYLLGGEADQFVEYIDGYANAEIKELTENDNCLTSWELSDEWLGSI